MTMYNPSKLSQPPDELQNILIVSSLPHVFVVMDRRNPVVSV